MDDAIETAPALAENAPAFNGAAVAPSTTHNAVIEAWFLDHLHNSVASQSVPAINHARQAIEALKIRLAPPDADPAPILELWTRQYFSAPAAGVTDDAQQCLLAALVDLKAALAA